MKIKTIIIMICVLNIHIYSGGRDETRFRMNGYLETGIDINHRVNRDETESQIIARGEIDISARPANTRRLRAEMGIEYNHRDTFVTVDKFYAQYGVTENGMLRVGIMKKSFGSEERAGLTERYFHRRSIINSELEDLGFLDHDLTLFYRHDINKNLRLTGALAWSVEDSLRYLQNYSAQYKTENNMTFIAALILRHYFIPDEVTALYGVEGIATTFASSLSFEYALAMRERIGWEHETELTFGTNPQIKILESNRDAFIFGIRTQERFIFNVGNENGRLQQIIPLVELAMYWNDLENSGNFDTQLRAGLALGFTQNSAFQFRNTFATILRTRDGETRVRRYRYDSEVVVVF